MQIKLNNRYLIRHGVYLAIILSLLAIIGYREMASPLSELESAMEEYNVEIWGRNGRFTILQNGNMLSETQCNAVNAYGVAVYASMSYICYAHIERGANHCSDLCVTYVNENMQTEWMAWYEDKPDPILINRYLPSGEIFSEYRKSEGKTIQRFDKTGNRLHPETGELLEKSGDNPKGDIQE